MNKKIYWIKYAINLFLNKGKYPQFLKSLITGYPPFWKIISANPGNIVYQQAVADTNINNDVKSFYSE